MMPPDFFDLVGDEGTPEELERLRRAHDLLVAAGPPPELSPRLAEAPSGIGRTSRLPSGSASWLATTAQEGSLTGAPRLRCTRSSRAARRTPRS